MNKSLFILLLYTCTGLCCFSDRYDRDTGLHGLIQRLQDRIHNFFKRKREQLQVSHYHEQDGVLIIDSSPIVIPSEQHAFTKTMNILINSSGTYVNGKRHNFSRGSNNGNNSWSWLGLGSSSIQLVQKQGQLPLAINNFGTLSITTFNNYKAISINHRNGPMEPNNYLNNTETKSVTTGNFFGQEEKDAENYNNYGTINVDYSNSYGDIEVNNFNSGTVSISSFNNFGSIRVNNSREVSLLDFATKPPIKIDVSNNFGSIITYNGRGVTKIQSDHNFGTIAND